MKQVDGSFELTVPLPTDETILYKYVVDGEWLVNQSQTVTRDGSGIANNSWKASESISATSAGSKIPEAGGLPVATAAASSDLNTTVMPSAEGQQTTLGEPGIFVPKDADALAAFETVRNVDPKTLNEPEEEAAELTPEEKKKQKKKLKRTQYKARKKQQKASADTTPEPETLDPAVVGAVGAGAAVGAGGAAATQDVSQTKAIPGTYVPTDGTVPETVFKSSKPVEDTAPEASESVNETAPAAADDVVPVSTVEVPIEEAVVDPISKEVEPPVEPTIEPAIKEPIENGNLQAPAVPVEKETNAPAAPVPVVATSEPVETVPDVAPLPVEATSKPVETLPDAAPVETVPDTAPVAPIVADAVDAKEVDAAPVTKGKTSYESDEIIIAHGGLSKEVEAQLRASDINVEEIKPTESEAKRLADEIQAETKPASGKAESKTAPKASKKEGKKKKNGFVSKLKKLFK